MVSQASFVYSMTFFVLLFPNFSWRYNWNKIARLSSSIKQDIGILSNTKYTEEKFAINYQFRDEGFATVSTFAAALNLDGDRLKHRLKHKGERVWSYELFKRLRRRRLKFTPGKRLWGRRTVPGSGQLGVPGGPSPKRYRQLERQRKILQNVLKELKGEDASGPEETCGTRWSKSLNEEWNSRFQPLKTYGTLKDVPEIKDRNRRHTADVSAVSPQTSTLYFPGSISLVWSPNDDETYISPSLPNLRLDSFTVEVWVKPEGGQNNPTTILGGGYVTSRNASLPVLNGWTLGIRSKEEGGDRRAVYFFSMENRHNGRLVTIYSVSHYKPEKWTHLAVSVERTAIRLYVNSVQEGAFRDYDKQVTTLPKNDLVNTFTMGGTAGKKDNFRGSVNRPRIWASPRTQTEIRKWMYKYDMDSLSKELVLQESFVNIEDRWWSPSRRFPEKNKDTMPLERDRVHYPELRAPPCGHTVCDNPKIVRSYVENWNLRKRKTLRYNVVSINGDRGEDPMLTQAHLEQQNVLIRDIFEKHNITWLPTLINVNNSNLRHKTIGCGPKKIGNRVCDLECMHERLGYDGGDCDTNESHCDPSMKGNGRCDPECNKVYHGWDSGDCCDRVNTNTDQTCFDPDSPHRGYLSVNEYKNILDADNFNQLTILFANWTNKNSIGISTFPWDKNVFSSQGGTIVQLKSYIRRDEISGLVHELGHNLGLLHVHHGSHDVNCDDACIELSPSMTTGDLCEDTEPTPMNTECREPNYTETVCNRQNFTSTPYNNFMSYADGSCQESFTAQQRARMHCYIDLVYDSWRKGSSQSPIPLPPRVVNSSSISKSVTITWPPPIDGRVVANIGESCDPRCNVRGSIRQFASNASSPDASSGSTWSASQATGPPDQDPCTLRGMHFWMPSGTSSTSAECGAKCYIDLYFEKLVVASILRLWVTYGTEEGEGVKRVEVNHPDGTKMMINSLHAYCDVPLTIRLSSHKPTSHIRVYVRRPYTAIDAAELISKPGEQDCSQCRPIRYKILRSPPFPEDVHVTTEQLLFTDSIEDDINYSYAVQPILGNRFGEPSATLQFQIGETFCGDGLIQKYNSKGQKESCDDGNMEDGDGCSPSCQMETGFWCKGEPSECYWHSGDGLCEDFEMKNKHEDCFFTPVGYLDQWVEEASSSSAALEALYSHRNGIGCSGINETLGPPDDSCQKHNSNGVPRLQRSWAPCVVPGLSTSGSVHWIKVTFRKPVQPTSVLIYLASITDLPRLTSKNALTLVLPNSETFVTDVMRLSCEDSPVEIVIPPDNDRPNVGEIVIKFSSYSAGIDAVALRSKLEVGTDVKISENSNSSSSCVTSDDVINANVTCTQKGRQYNDVAVGSSWETHTACVVNCHQGYLPKSTQKMQCKDGTWDVSAKCIPVSCRPPSHVKFASFHCPSQYKFNAVCSFSCVRTTQMIGTNNTFRCTEKGTWTPPIAYCEKLCGPPPRIAFSMSACTSLQHRASRPLETCKYRCDVGYHVQQQASTKRNFRLTCGINGTWTGPGCQPTVCPPLPIALTGQYHCTRGSVYGSVCKMPCQGESAGIIDVITCHSDGLWNASFSACPWTPSKCKKPRPPPGINIVCAGYGAGQTCQVSCALKEGHSPYDIIVVKEIDQSERNTQENNKSRTLYCVGKEWQPKPENLACVDECSPQFIRDKWCDPNNNRAYCNWDGGDCCESTTTGTKVEPFPTTCTEKCACKDPNAIENKVEEEMRNSVVVVPLNAPASHEIVVLHSTKQSSSSLDSRLIEETNTSNSPLQDTHDLFQRSKTRPPSRKRKRVRDGAISRSSANESESEENAGSGSQKSVRRKSRHGQAKNRRHTKRSSKGRQKKLLE